MRLHVTSCSLLVNVSQFSIRRVVPSVFKIIGPISSKLMVSPKRMVGRLEPGFGGGSLGRSFPSEEAANASAFSEDDDAIIQTDNRNKEAPFRMLTGR